LPPYLTDPAGSGGASSHSSDTYATVRGFNAKLSLCETQKRQISLNRFPCSKNMAEQVSTAVIYVQSLQKNSAYLELTSNADVEAQKTRLRLLGNPFAVVAESAPSHIQMELIELLF